MNQLIDVKAVAPPKQSVPRKGSGQVASTEEYQALYRQSIENPTLFFGEQARKLLHWYRDFDTVVSGDFYGFSNPPSWFNGGLINACYNAVDRHANETPNQVALIYEADDERLNYNVTYEELLARVCQTAQMLKSIGVKKGDIVTVYMPTIPETVYTILAICRIGAMFSLVFAGFSPNSLRDRIQHANSRVVITTDQALRGGKVVETKNLVDQALEGTDCVEHVVVVERTGAKVNMVEGRDFSYNKTVPTFGVYCPVEWVDSEHPFFLMYTSGSTGKPKGLQQSTAGFLLGTVLSSKHVFGVSQGDVYFCAADVGWVLGLSHAIFGPLLNHATSIIFESTPLHPTPTRLFDVIDRHKATHLYTAPTVLRLLRQHDEGQIKKYDLSSLRCLGTAGEPIAKDVWEWYFNEVGRRRCSICDTYWLTESCMVMLTTIPGVSNMKPGAAGMPFFGVKPKLLDDKGHEITSRPAEGTLVFKNPWPSMARTVRGDHQRYQETYLKPFPGYFFTGDGAVFDKNNTIFITGRVDDVVNVSGHRISTAEIESAIMTAQAENLSIASETAVIGVNDDVTGQALNAFIVLEPHFQDKGHAKVVEHAIEHVAKGIGKFAVPKKLFLVKDLPKTRSGKIMRRVLRKIASGEEDQLSDLSTLSEPAVIDHIVQVVKASSSQPRARL